MNGLHDVGGMDGFGPVVVEEDEPVFHHDWEKGVFAMFFPILKNDICNENEFRAIQERLPPLDYLTLRYYERWFAAFEEACVLDGVTTRAEVDEYAKRYRLDPTMPLPSPEGADEVTRDLLEYQVGRPSPKHAVDRPRRFKVGDRVVVKEDHPLGYTRRARYIRGKQGVVVRAYDSFEYGDATGNSLPDDPQYFYALKFDARTLWGELADPAASVCFDVAETYFDLDSSAL